MQLKFLLFEAIQQEKKHSLQEVWNIQIIDYLETLLICYQYLSYVYVIMLDRKNTEE